MRVSHNFKYWWVPWVPLAIAIVLFALSVYSAITGTVFPRIKAYGPCNVREFVTLLVHAAGWSVTLAGILFAGKYALLGLTFQALLKLHEDEGSPKQKAAKELVSKAKPAKDFSGNIYGHVREYMKSLSDKDKKELDNARRRISHFWYRAARLVDLGILGPEEVFESVGSPDILEIIEPLEAIRAENDNPAWQPRPWPPMKLFIVWYKQQKRKEMGQLRQEVPARPDLYKESKHSRACTADNVRADSE